MKNRLLATLSLAAIAACGGAPEILPYEVKSVAASVETDAMTGRGDRADDPALWVSSANPEHALILGTNKDTGLYAYTLDGSEQQRLLVGAVNNVDVRGDYAVASNDATNALSWFHIAVVHGTPQVAHIGDTTLPLIEPYGVCLGYVGNQLTAGVTYKDGTTELWSATIQPDGTPAISPQRTLKLASQLEGCVFDDEHQRLFIGEENYGVWVLDLADAGSAPVEVDSIAAGNGLVADVEGVSLYLKPDGAGYLVVSAQKADRFVIYERLPPYKVIGAVHVDSSEDEGFDAVTHTDGLDANSIPLPGYPRGVLIVQDDGNPRSGVDQNFKVVDWRAVEIALGL